MRENFAPSLARVLVHEGGYVDDPHDPGGATNHGVTQAVYDSWRMDQRLPQRAVRDIEGTEVAAIYRKLYWDAVKADYLPAGVDYAVFDFAVNSGVGRATRFLQRAASVADDGQIGPVTLAAIRTLNPAELAAAICDARLKFLQGLATFPRFGGGWTARVNDVRATAVAMA